MKMKRSVTRRYCFEAAHWLPGVPEGHKCRRVHGHNYEIEVTLQGIPDHRGFILDFFEMDAIVDPIVARIDHRTLNDIAGLENPTAELIAAWFTKQIKLPDSTSLKRIRVYETKDCWAEAEVEL